MRPSLVFGLAILAACGLSALGGVEGATDAASKAAGPSPEIYRLYAARDVNGLRALADKGDPWAEFYLSGIDPDQRDAMRWLTAAADSNVIPAMTELAYDVKSRGDLAGSTGWLARAAALGDAADARDYGQALLDGTGVAADPAQALQWFLAAVNDGDRYAHLSVAELYDGGTGTAHDPFLAYVYTLTALRVLDFSDQYLVDEARALKSRIEPELSPDDRRRAEMRADTIMAALRF